MRQKFKNYISYTLIAISSIFAALGFITLATWYIALTPSTYTQALEETGVYKNAAKTLESYVANKILNINTFLADEIINTVNESVAGTDYEQYINNPFVENVIRSLTERFATNITISLAESFNLEQSIQNISKNLIEDYITWLKDENYVQPIELALIPPKDDVKNMSNEDVINIIGTYVTVSKYHVNDLEKCQSHKEEEKNLEYISKLQFGNLTCTTETIQDALIKTIQEQNQTNHPSSILTIIQNYIYINQSKISQLFELFKYVLYIVSYVKEVTFAEKLLVETVKYASIVLIGLSLITSTIAYFLRKTRSILTWVHTYTIAAIITIIYALLQITVITSAINKLLPTSFTNTNVSDIPAANLAMLSVSIKNFFITVHETINTFVLRVGLTILLIALLIYLGRYIYFRYKLKQKAKKYYKIAKNKTNQAMSKKVKSKKPR